MTTENEKFDSWAIVEVMGHRTLAGKVTEQEIAGKMLLRCDIPGKGDDFVLTQFIGPDSIYALTPVSEAVARAKAKHVDPSPVHTWELPSPVIDVDDDDDDESFNPDFMGDTA